jgi:ATP-dependent exoDNAse (exonuclease V) beta subunit
MIGAKHRLSEVPYELNSTKISEKRPDLLLQDKDGNWHVIDYKTDHFEQSGLGKQIKHHSEQVLEYANDIEALTGVKAKPWIYFAAYGQLSLIEATKETSLV